MEVFLSDGDQAIITARESQKTFKRDDARDFILKEMRQQRRVNPHDYGVPWEKVTSQPRP